MEPKNVDRRDCLAWSIITGAQYSYQVGKQISRWTTPDRYFVSFPYGMFTPYYMSDARAKISSNDPFYVSYEGKSFKDGLYLPFTFTPEDFLQCRRTFRKNEARGYDSNVERLPLEERYTGRYFTHDFVFNEVITDDAAVVELPWYYDISSWDKLKLWLGSEHKLKKPPKFISSYNEWNPLGRDVEE